MCSDSLFILFATQKPHYPHGTGGIRIWNMVLSTWSQLFTGICFKLLSHSVFYIANYGSAQAKWVPKLNYSTQRFKFNAKSKGIQLSLAIITYIIIANSCHHNICKNDSNDRSTKTVNQSKVLSITLARHNHYIYWVRSRFMGNNEDRIFTVLTVIYPKSSCGESLYP